MNTVTQEGAVAPVFLIGGGWRTDAVAHTYGLFVTACGAGARIACVLLEEPGRAPYHARFVDVLRGAGASDVQTIFVGAASDLSLDQLDGADGVLVGGGLTPAYMAALAGVRDALGPWLRNRAIPYAGFSAGAAVAADHAVIGGWRLATTGGTLTVCPEEVAEDLDEVRVVPGLGLVPFAVDIHAGHWGTLSRLVSVVDAGMVAEGWAIDEDTMLRVDDGTVTVHGVGRAYRVCRTDGVVSVDVQTAIQDASTR